MQEAVLDLANPTVAARGSFAFWAYYGGATALSKLTLLPICAGQLVTVAPANKPTCNIKDRSSSAAAGPASSLPRMELLTRMIASSWAETHDPS